VPMSCFVTSINGIILKQLLLILFGFLLGFIPPWCRRKRRLKTHWCALRAEIDQCKEKAETLLGDKVMSPLYRLPLLAYQISFPVLLADGALEESEAVIVGKFFGLVQDINRGLDNAWEMFKSGNTENLEKEFNRNFLKARELIEAEEVRDSLYEKTKLIVDEKTALKSWQFKMST